MNEVQKNYIGLKNDMHDLIRSYTAWLKAHEQYVPDSWTFQAMNVSLSDDLLNCLVNCINLSKAIEHTTD